MYLPLYVRPRREGTTLGLLGSGSGLGTQQLCINHFKMEGKISFHLSDFKDHD